MKGFFASNNNDSVETLEPRVTHMAPSFDPVDVINSQVGVDSTIENKAEKTEQRTSYTNLPAEEILATTKITSTMEIYGEIKSKDAIASEGKIFGNITTAQSFSSNNLTVGNINAKKAVINRGRVKGDIFTQETTSIGDGSIMVGNIVANDTIIYGKVKGNLDIKEGTTLLKDALIAGDIIATKITMEQGARINGNVTMRGQSEILDIESEFDLGGDF